MEWPFLLHQDIPRQQPYCSHQHRCKAWSCWDCLLSRWVKGGRFSCCPLRRSPANIGSKKGNGVVDAASYFTPPVLVPIAVVLGNVAVGISKLPNFSLTYAIDGLQVVTGSFHSVGLSHLAGCLTFHLLSRTTFTPKNTRGLQLLPPCPCSSPSRS